VFRVEISPSAVSELLAVKRNDTALYKRMSSAFDSLAEDPYQGKKLKGKLAGYYSLRTGVYRIIYRVYKERLLIWIVDLGPRREIYR
jgi:mRNA interferase RelE/StbE